MTTCVKGRFDDAAFERVYRRGVRAGRESASKAALDG